MSPIIDNKVSFVPDDETLHRGLASILCAGDTEYRQSDFSVLGRKYNAHSSTYPSEIITCRMGDSRTFLLHCKYSNEHEPKGHRKGIIHESRIYREILQESTSTTPKYYGIYHDAEKGNVWLVLEHIANALSASKCENGLRYSARWLGNFHRKNARICTAFSMLETYDAEFYKKWARQTKSFISREQSHLGWLSDLCDHYEKLIGLLLSVEQTVIHGEFYTSNILVKDKSVFPIDWESAAVAAGELDLVTLTEGWPEPTVAECISEYQKHRWPEGVPASYCETLSVARIHWQLRWLGDNPNWTRQKKLWRLTVLRQEGEQLGLI